MFFEQFIVFLIIFSLQKAKKKCQLENDAEISEKKFFPGNFGI